MPIIDFRFRPSTPDAVNGMLTPGGVFSPMFEYFNYAERAKPEPIEDIVKHLHDSEVVKGCVIGRDAETTYNLKSSNPGILTLMEKYPDLFIGFAGLDPHKGMEAVYDLARLVTKEGMRGAAIDPYLAKIPADHAKFYPLYAKCVELDIPIVITTGPATLVRGAVMEDASPARIDRVACDFPDLKIVISHGGYPYVNEAIMVVQRNKNVYMDLAEYEEQPFSEKYIEAANTILEDKILFASAAPFMDFQEQIALYKRLPFKPKVLEKIMYTNAAKLLGL
ncbi:MAG: amidohydrolase [Desulfovibrionaceae bacterium]|nr:amidohydrolase [Desulfovibrionaceae bacterium]